MWVGCGRCGRKRRNANDLSVPLDAVGQPVFAGTWFYNDNAVFVLLIWSSCARPRPTVMRSASIRDLT